MASSSMCDNEVSSSDAATPRVGFIRMSRGPSYLKLKPRVGSSNCIEEHPRSTRTASTPSGAAVARKLEMPAKFIRRRWMDASGATSDRSRASVFGSSMGSASTPRKHPPGCIAFNIAEACPPYPSVQSTTVSPGESANTCITSSTIMGRCIPAGVLPPSTILRMSSGYFSGWCSLYLSWKFLGFLPA